MNIQQRNRLKFHCSKVQQNGQELSFLFLIFLTLFRLRLLILGVFNFLGSYTLFFISLNFYISLNDKLEKKRKIFSDKSQNK